MNVDVLVIWIVVGGITGLLASMLLSHVPMGVLGSLIFGVLGAVVAGLVYPVLDLPVPPGIITDVGVAFVGSVLLLALAQKL